MMFIAADPIEPAFFRVGHTVDIASVQFRALNRIKLTVSNWLGLLRVVAGDSGPRHEVEIAELHVGPLVLCRYAFNNGSISFAIKRAANYRNATAP